MLVLEAANYFLAAIMVLVFFTWIHLLKTMLKDSAATPKLGNKIPPSTPKVSIILPARNEEGYIRRCVDSLAAQDYADYEIIAIDDSSEDDTWNIMQRAAEKYENIIPIRAGPKPAGWVGKNWPCAQGRKRASGKLLFFTDADTIHRPHALSSAVAHMFSSKLDAISVMPRLVSSDFWTSATLPMITVFLNTIYSAAKVNDPKKDTGYFYGSFFIMDAAAYDAIGGHYATRGEIIEDGVLGKTVKKSGYRMMIVSGTDTVSAVWARDRKTLWNAIKRLMVPIAVSSQKQAVGISVAVGFLMLAPFILFPYSALLFLYGAGPAALLASSAASLAAVFAAAVTDSRILGFAARFGALAPLGAAVVTCGFFSGALVPNGGGVWWRGTRYSKNDCKKATPNF